MKFKFYELSVSIIKNDMTHVILNYVDGASKEVIESNIKLKMATVLEDDSNNSFIVNGYFGDYMILRSYKLHTHPSGKYLISKK